jgi:type IV pilus assembly protein PilV
MRANMPGVTAGNYHLPTATQDVDCTTITGCTPAEMAGHDAFEWSAGIQASLPAGEGVVCIDSTPQDGADATNPACDNAGNLFAIKLWWDDDRDPATANQRFVTSFLP